MNKTTIVKSTALLVFGVLMVSANSAFAGDAVERVVLNVSVADLNLQTDEDLQRLNYRIKRAARNVCSYRSLREAGSLRASTRSKTCVDNALRSTYEQLDRRLLTRLVQLQDRGIERLMRAGNGDT